MFTKDDNIEFQNVGVQRRTPREIHLQISARVMHYFSVRLSFFIETISKGFVFVTGLFNIL